MLTEESDIEDTHLKDEITSSSRVVGQKSKTRHEGRKGSKPPGDDRSKRRQQFGPRVSVEYEYEEEEGLFILTKQEPRAIRGKICLQLLVRDSP